MAPQNALQLFDEQRVRTVWDEGEEKWYISIVDAIAVLTDSPDPRNYWKVLKHRLKAEGNESVTNCNQLKLPSADGKRYLTDVADVEQLFRLIQSVPSPSYKQSPCTKRHLNGNTLEKNSVYFSAMPKSIRCF